MLRFVMLSVVALFSSTTAWAGWTPSVSFEPRDGSWLKVVGTDGVQVTVEHQGHPRRDSVPTVFDLGYGDSFVRVVAVAPDGQRWEQKVEIRQHHQTVLRLDYAADAGAMVSPTQQCLSGSWSRGEPGAQNLLVLSLSDDMLFRMAFYDAGSGGLAADEMAGTYELIGDQTLRLTQRDAGWQVVLVEDFTVASCGGGQLTLSDAANGPFSVTRLCNAVPALPGAVDPYYPTGAVCVY